MLFYEKFIDNLVDVVCVEDVDDVVDYVLIEIRRCKDSEVEGCRGVVMQKVVLERCNDGEVE